MITNNLQILDVNEMIAYLYSYNQYYYKPIVLLSVSLVLHFMQIFLLVYVSDLQSYIRLVLPKKRTTETVVKDSVPIVLLSLGPLTWLSIAACLQSYFLQDLCCSFATRVAIVSLVSHSCCSCCRRFAIVLLVFHFFCTRIARVWRSCEIDQILL